MFKIFMFIVEMTTFILVVLYVTVFCTGCVTTSKAVIHANKTVDLQNDPLQGDMQVGVRLEFFRDHTKR
jgi:uncharacterized lipoprotein YajG